MRRRERNVLQLAVRLIAEQATAADAIVDESLDAGLEGSPSETASSRAGGTLSSFVVIPINARNPGRARRRRRADQQYARQAAWFEARADGPGHYSRRCAYCGGSFYGARSTATYCRPSCRVQAHKRRVANRTAHCPGCGKAFETQGWRRVFCGDTCRVAYWRYAEAATG
jgi:hypothetical protein